MDDVLWNSIASKEEGRRNAPSQSGGNTGGAHGHAPCPNGRFRACGLRDGKVYLELAWMRSPAGLAAHPPHAAHSFSSFSRPGAWILAWMRCTDEDTVKLSHVVQLVSLAKETMQLCKRTLYCFSFSDIKVTRVWGVRRSQRSAPEVVLVLIAAVALDLGPALWSRALRSRA